MIRVCPNPIPWNKVFRRLSIIADARPNLPKPPTPLILNGWVFSNDTEKMNRWNETIEWAKKADCDDIVLLLKDDDYYYTESLTTYAIGPMGGPMYRDWDFESKEKPDENALKITFYKLLEEWVLIAGDIASMTRPIGFSGIKSRRLVVAVLADIDPPWGNWDRLSLHPEQRRTFTRFRAAVNTAIAPHEVDHIDFTKEIPNKALRPTATCG